MITHHCRIVNNQIFLDGRMLFEQGPATVDDFFAAAYTALGINYPKFYKMDNLSKAGFLAAEVLLANSARTAYSDEKVSIVLANAHSSLDTDVRYATSMRSIPSPALFVYTLPNIVAGEICIRHKIKGENAFFVSEQFDPVLFTTYVSMLPPDHLSIVGWVDVMGQHHDVFLYLHDNTNAGLEHTALILKELYNQEYGTVNG